MSTTFLSDKLTEVVKRDGSKVPFDSKKIHAAIEKAFRDVYEIEKQPLPEALGAKIEEISSLVSNRSLDLAEDGVILNIEDIQDLVETQLMDAGEHGVARSYILYREERKKARILRTDKNPSEQVHGMHITFPDGSRHPLNLAALRLRIMLASEGLDYSCSIDQLMQDAIKTLYDGASVQEVQKALVYAARSKIEIDHSYSYLTARLLLQEIYAEALGFDPIEKWNGGSLLQNLEPHYRKGFVDYIHMGVKIERLSPKLLDFNLELLADMLVPKRDEKFQYLGLHILYDRYLVNDGKNRLETPQYFWMRVAMGLAIYEKDKEKRAAEFYDVLSQFRFVSSTPTLFNSGTCHSQLSSCFISTVYDDLENIFKVISDNAKLSKWAGGIGNDWTYVRAAGALIKGTGGLTQGIIPFLKVANDTAVAVNQGGKRKGVNCAYLETWHLDIEDFLELRKNTGDERRRTHDMNTANWIPDLFMQRVAENGTWTLFNPYDAPDLHDLYGRAFNLRYKEYEQLALQGSIKQFKVIPAIDLWRKMITMLYETGHPWMTFKDPCNIRSPQSHVGVIHSSNLCTEITLNNSNTETAVCNLGSLNLAAHIKTENNSKSIDRLMLASTINIAMRMLDNVIDINFYPIPEAKHANMLHRPVGLGVMAFQDALYLLGQPYDSEEAIELADTVQELIAYHAILASTELAKEKGAYSSYPGSKWSQGLLPIDTIDLLKKERQGNLEMDQTVRLNWDPVRAAIQKYGMRNSNVMALAPTATIANIIGVFASIDPAYSNLFSRSNLSGEFTMLNPYLIDELKKIDLWDDEMLEELKYYDGSIQEISKIPDHLKRLFKTAFEVDPDYLIDCASRRQKWIDQSQSLNLYLRSSSGKVLSDMYFLAWRKGLKTTYYLRSQAATQVEKSTIDINKKGIQPRWMKNKSASSNIQVMRKPNEPKACSLEDPTCESCQ